MNTSKRYFTSKEYNTIVLKLTSSSYEYSKNKEEYDLLMDKAYHIFLFTLLIQKLCIQYSLEIGLNIILVLLMS